MLCSTLRQIPDHQEVFLSPGSLTTVVVELDEYVSPELPAQGSTAADVAAVTYHLNDLIDPCDPAEVVLQPQAVTMQSQTLSQYPAYMASAKIISQEQERKVPSLLPIEWQHTPQMREVNTSVHLLVLRMKDRGTDLLVHVNVPWKELGSQQSVEAEEGGAKTILETLIKTLDVKDFGLFGG